MSLNKFSNLRVNLGAKSSRFVVDLKKDLAEEIMVEKTKNRRAGNFETRLESRLEKFAEINYKEYLGAGKKRSKALALNLRGGLLSLIVNAKQKAQFTKKSKTIIRDGGEPVSLLGQLAFIELGKLILLILKQAVILIYKICYWAGWIIVFLLRLAFLILSAITGPILKLINYLFYKLQIAFSKFLNNFLAKYQATQSLILASAASIKKKNSLKQEPVIKRALPKYSAKEQISYLKPVLIFAGVLLIIILPVKAYTYYRSIDGLKGRVLGASESAMNNLLNGGKSAANLDFKQANISFTQASNNFLTVKNQLEEIDGLLFALASVVPDKNVQLAAASKNIVRAGSLSAEAGKNLSLAVDSLFNYQSGNTGQALLNLSSYGRRAIINLTELGSELELINSDVIPEAYRKKFILLKQKTQELQGGLKEFLGIIDNLESFLGGSALKRYLLTFQNNSELRASGGFLGSFALVDFSRGEIKNIEVPGGGSYDTDAGLLKKIKAPEPLRLVRPDWHFWDANWWPDWPTSARKLAWFYENSDGSTVDGVISFTPTVMERLLKIIGPIDMREKYGLVINADNFWLETQTLSEQKPDVTKQPKKIVGDLMNKIIEELPKRINKNNFISLLKAVEESLADKNILFYFTDQKLQTEIENLGWDGKIKATDGDYLNVVNTNIAGGKSDRTIKQQIIHQAEIQSDGTIIDNLTVKRTHEAIKRAPFTGVRNVNWLRVYVPLGSKLISASGFKPVDKIFFKPVEDGWQNDSDVERSEGLAATDELSGTKIYNELGKTVFANWSQLDPGQSIEINIKYQLPFKLTDKKTKPEPEIFSQLLDKAGALINPEQKNIFSYSLLAQKQPGMNSSGIISELKLSDNFQPLWKFPDDLAINKSGWFRTENLDQDKLMAIIVEER